ncbi:MAG: hypothetical protein ACLRFL_03070 [Clostridia bacterium]
MKKKILLISNLLVFIVPFLILFETEKSKFFGTTIQGKMSAIDSIVCIFRNNLQDITFWAIITFVSYYIVCILMFLNIIKLFTIDTYNKDNDKKNQRISDIPSIIIVILTTIAILIPYFFLVNNKGVELNTFGYLMFVLMALVNMITRIYFYYNK